MLHARYDVLFGPVAGAGNLGVTSEQWKFQGPAIATLAAGFIAPIPLP
jgi:hypothetical protein